MIYYILFSAYILSSQSSLLKANIKEADTLILSGDFTVNVRHAEQDLILFVSPGISSARILNPLIAEKLELKGGWIGGKHLVGPVELKASSRRIHIDYANDRKKDRVFWFDRPASQKFDGIIAPSTLPYKIIRYNFHPKSKDETIYALPIKKRGGLSLKGGYGIFQFQDKEIKVGFDFERDKTLINAPTANLFASAANGTLIEETQKTPIRFGVERPVQLLKLSKSIIVAGLPIDQILVRVSDDGDASNIISEEEHNIDEDEAIIDGDAIIVSGKSKKKRNYTMILGRDFIKGCSSITYDMNMLLLRMSCQAPLGKNIPKI